MLAYNYIYIINVIMKRKQLLTKAVLQFWMSTIIVTQDTLSEVWRETEYFIIQGVFEYDFQVSSLKQCLHWIYGKCLYTYLVFHFKNVYKSVILWKVSQNTDFFPRFSCECVTYYSWVFLCVSVITAFNCTVWKSYYDERKVSELRLTIILHIFQQDLNSCPAEKWR
jgi:hypothetical protein